MGFSTAIEDRGHEDTCLVFPKGGCVWDLNIALDGAVAEDLGHNAGDVQRDAL